MITLRGYEGFNKRFDKKYIYLLIKKIKFVSFGTLLQATMITCRFDRYRVSLFHLTQIENTKLSLPRIGIIMYV